MKIKTIVKLEHLIITKYKLNWLLRLYSINWLTCGVRGYRLAPDYRHVPMTLKEAITAHRSRLDKQSRTEDS